MRGILSFNRVPLNVVGVTVLASYAAQFLALIQGFPLWGIALATLLPWVPVFTLEMMWRYRHYQWLALFEVVLISQIGHFIEHLVQMYQIHVLGLRGPAAGGIFSQLNVEWVHFLFNTYLLAAFLALAFRFRRNPWLWVALGAAVLHETEHLYIMIRFLRTGIPGLPGLLARGGAIGIPLSRADVHFLYNFVESIPMMLAFAWQMRAAYDEWLARVFPRLRPQDLAAATQRLETVRAPQGEVIVREGEVADRFFIITQGEVGEPRVATVRARVPTELLSLNRALFRGLIAESAETVRDLEQVVQQRLAGLKPG